LTLINERESREREYFYYKAYTYHDIADKVKVERVNAFEKRNVPDFSELIIKIDGVEDYTTVVLNPDNHKYDRVVHKKKLRQHKYGFPQNLELYLLHQAPQFEGIEWRIEGVAADLINFTLPQIPTYLSQEYPSLQNIKFNQPKSIMFTKKQPGGGQISITETIPKKQ
jgi:hypothetical protein